MFLIWCMRVHARAIACLYHLGQVYIVFTSCLKQYRSILFLLSTEIANVCKGGYTYDVRENCPVFKTPPLSSYVRSSSTPLTLDVQFQTNPPRSPNDNQSIKRKHNPRMTIICFQTFPSGRLSFSVSSHLSCLAFH